MIQYNETRIQKIIVHKVGNSTENSILNREELAFDRKNEEKTILNFFLKPFSTQFEMFNFSHEVEIGINPVFKCCNDIFRDKNFIDTSIKLTDYLLSCSKHPNIKSGELFIVKFDEILFNNEYCEAIGIFKTENKDKFFEASEKSNELNLALKNGINTNKFDKGCLIFNVNEDNGYKVCLIDNKSKGYDAQYWKDEFLKVIEEKDEFHQTSQFLGIAKQFITKQFPVDFETSKADQIDLLNRSVDYFKNHDNFQLNEFEKNVLQHKNVITSFKKFDLSYRADKDISIEDKFPISPQAVKKQERVFKSVLKLDNNFHIYILGNKELIEQGTDSQGRKFYKIFYDVES